MNVTLKLPDELVRKARHLAIDENTSLSAIVCELLDALIKERSVRREKAPNLAESLLLPEEPEWFTETEFPQPDRSAPSRATPFQLESRSQD